MIVPPLTRDQVRRVDQIAIQEYGIHGIVLMENAGRGAAEIIDRISPVGLIVIMAGAGNNGGDGYVIARHLELAGRQVLIVSAVDLDRLNGDAAINAKIAKRSDMEIRIVKEDAQVSKHVAGAATVVDCLLGTGAQGPLRAPYADFVSSANSLSDAMRIAIDIPTGLDCDTGTANEPTFCSDHTITFVANKVGFQQNNADRFVGVVHEVGIGVPRKLLDDLF